MQSVDYWIQRALQREADAFQSTSATVNRLRSIYDNAAARLVRVANNIFANYSKSAGVTPEAATQLLSVQETAETLAVLREEYSKTGSIEALAKLSAPAYAYRISRAQAMRKAIDAETTALAEQEEQTGAKQLVKAYDDAYYKTMHDTAQAAEQDIAFSPLPQRAVTEALENKWKGENYSDRVWKNTKLVAQEAGRIIDEGISSGASVAQMSHDIKDLFNVASYASERLVRTEINRMHNDATIKSYKAMGVDDYTFLATLDARTCSVCGALDGKHFKVADAQTGVNLPPIHPNDRCTTVAYYPGDKITGTRIARNPETGKNYKVDRSMTYEQWRKEISEKYGADSLEKAQKRYANLKSDAAQQQDMRKVLGKNVPTKIADFQDLKYNNPDEWERLKKAYPMVSALKQLGIKGKISIPVKDIDIESLGFDDEHVNVNRNHAVTEQEAKGFIQQADVSITKWNGQFENYYSKDGAAYVNVEGNYIRTAYKADQFKGEPDKIHEVIEKYAQGNVPPNKSGN